MINSILYPQQLQNHGQSLERSSSPSLGEEGKLQEQETQEKGMELDGESDSHSHTKTVQALRKYLQRKFSSEDSSSERESQSPQDTENVTSLVETTAPEEEPKSTLTCSIVYSNTNNSSGRNIFPLQKQRSLDDYSHSAYAVPSADLFIRTDLCVPILLSRCTLCDESFELDDELRAHMREKHWNYFFSDPSPSTQNSYFHMEDENSDYEVLDLSMRKSNQSTGSLPNLTMMKPIFQDSLLSSRMMTDSIGNFKSKKAVKCATCGKGFSTKWNWKQHQKIHLRENLQAYYPQ